MHSIRNASTQQPRQIVGLDLLRFFAALLVMLHHLGWRVWFQGYVVPMNYTYLEPIGRAGFIGVEIFFVLSGFVIAYSAQTATAKDFAISRAVRLYPAAWVCATLTAIFALVAAAKMHLQIGNVPVQSDLFLNWIDSLWLSPLGPWIDGSYWTLGIEIGFYLQVFLLLRFRRFHWLGPWMTVVGLVSIFGLILQANLEYLQRACPPLAFYATHMDLHGALFLLSHHGCLFAIGVFLWLCFFDRVTKARIVTIGIMLVGALCDIRLRTGWHGLWRLPLLIWSVAMLVMVACIRYNPQIHKVLGVRGAAVARRLGLVTYPLYLLHQMIGYMLLAFLKGHLPDLLNLLLTITLLIALAFGVNLLAETPLQAWLRRLLGGRRVATVPAATAP